MPVPKRKRSRARRDSRFANKGLKIKSLTECRNCQAPLVTHVACKKCGFYKGEKVLATKEDRSQRRQELKAVREQAKQTASSAAKAE
jgi:large subunit ribosomal protein L32